MFSETRNPNDQVLTNIAFVGSTGSGKSSTCNTLYANPHNSPFLVGHESTSCTENVATHIQQDKAIKIIDTPGFGDTRFDEKKIDTIIEQFFQAVLDPKTKSTNHVDAFVLVARLNPRPQTLKSDLERIRNTFGTIAMKSTLLLFIFDNGRGDYASFLPTLTQMREIVTIIREGKQEEPNEDWFCIWDNLNPRPTQEQEFFDKIRRLEPYTCQKFLEAQKEIRERLDAQSQVELERQIARIKKDYDEDSEAQEREIAQLRANHELERKELFEARERAQKSAFQMASQLQAMSEENKRDMASLYAKIRQEGSANLQKIQRMIEETQAAQSEQVARTLQEKVQDNVRVNDQRLPMKAEKDMYEKKEQAQRLWSPEQAKPVHLDHDKIGKREQVEEEIQDKREPKDVYRGDLKSSGNNDENRFMAQLQQMQEKMKKDREELYLKMQQEDEQDMKEMQQRINENNMNHQRNLNQVLKAGQDLNDQYNTLLNRPVQPSRAPVQNWQAIGINEGLSRNNNLNNYVVEGPNVERKGGVGVNNDPQMQLQQMQENFKKERENLAEQARKENEQDMTDLLQVFQEKQAAHQAQLNEILKQQQQMLDWNMAVELSNNQPPMQPMNVQSGYIANNQGSHHGYAGNQHNYPAQPGYQNIPGSINQYPQQNTHVYGPNQLNYPAQFGNPNPGPNQNFGGPYQNYQQQANFAVPPQKQENQGVVKKTLNGLMAFFK